jgi:phosphonate transport system substrate-binding protein
MRSAVVWMLAVAAPLTAQRAAEATRREASQVLTFGVYTSEKAAAIYRMLLPLVESLQQSLDEKLPVAVDVQFKICKTYEEAQEALIRGELDFAKFGPASYVIVKRRSPGVTLLAMEDNGGKKSFEGFIVVRNDSPIRALADLRGKRFAFGDETSTIGRYLVQHELLRAGIRARDLAGYQYLGRHDKVFKCVELGDFDAGAIRDNTFTKLNKDGKLRVLARFDNVTQPWIARAGLDPRIVRALTKTLLELKDPDVLRGIQVDGFFPAEDADYEPIRRAMQAAIEFVQPEPVKAPPQPAGPGK